MQEALDMVNVVEVILIKKEVIMPGGDRTGPNANGPMTGRRLGFCTGNDRPGYEMIPGGFAHRYGRGGGQGRNKGGAFGTGGFCVCAKCGKKIPHQQGEKCTTIKCPACRHTMIREELLKK